MFAHGYARRATFTVTNVFRVKLLLSAAKQESVLDAITITEVKASMIKRFIAFMIIPLYMAISAGSTAVILQIYATIIQSQYGNNVNCCRKLIIF